jgi:hypothetical protein
MRYLLIGLLGVGFVVLFPALYVGAVVICDRLHPEREAW